MTSIAAQLKKENKADSVHEFERGGKHYIQLEYINEFADVYEVRGNHAVKVF